MTEEEFHIQMAEARERGRAERQPEIDALKAERDAHRDNAQQLVETNAALKAEVERLRKDAERLQYLLENYISATCINADRLELSRKAIDAAMKETK